MKVPVLVCGYLPHAEQTVAERVESPSDWKVAVQEVARPYSGEMTFVVALDDRVRRKPAGVWEDLPLVPQEWTRAQLSSQEDFTVIGFNNMSMQPLMLHVQAANWIIAAQCVLAERNQDGFRFVAAFDGHIQKSDVLGAFFRVDANGRVGDAA